MFRRYWPIFAGYLIIWLVVLPAALGNYLSNSFRFFENLQPHELELRIGQTILNIGFYGGLILSGIFAILLAMAAYNYLYSAKSVSLFCSLPIRREGIFFSLYSSSMAGMLAANLLVFGVSVLVASAYGYLAESFGFLLQWLAIVCLMNIFYFGFASLCASFTGHVLVLPVVYTVLNFTAYVVSMLVQQVMNLLVYGLASSLESPLSFLSPPVYMLANMGVRNHGDSNAEGVWINTDVYFQGWLPLVLFAVAGLVFALVTVVLIRRRRMETAGDVVALRPLKPIFKYCLAFGCALVIGIAIFYSVFNASSPSALYYMLLCMLFGGFVGYFASEMLLKKTLRVFGGRTWVGMGAVALVIACFLFAAEYDAFGLERKVPEAGEIENVQIWTAGENTVFDQEDNIQTITALHREIVENKVQYEALTDKSEANDYSSYLAITYIYKDGRTLTRNYEIYQNVGTDFQVLTDLLNTKEAIDWRKRLTFPVSPAVIADAGIQYLDSKTQQYQYEPLSSEEAYDLYINCILPDIEDGSLGKIWLTPDEEYYQTVYDCTINFSVLKRSEDGSYNSEYFYTTLTTKAARTKAWIAENLDIEPVLQVRNESGPKAVEVPLYH